MGYLHFIRTNWLFLLAGFLLTFTSSYGQATSLSALAMIWAGVLTDRFRVRVLAVVMMLGLAAACVAMALVQSWVLLVAVIFALRFTGQGMMSQLGAVAMLRWFEKTRGKALSLSSMGFAAGQAILPVVFVALFAVTGWRNLWVLAAVIIVATIPVVWVLLRRERTPQNMADEAQIAGMFGRHWTRAEMLRSGLFFAIVPMVLGPSAFGTALFWLGD